VLERHGEKNANHNQRMNGPRKTILRRALGSEGEKREKEKKSGSANPGRIEKAVGGKLRKDHQTQGPCFKKKGSASRSWKRGQPKEAQSTRRL